MYLHRALLDASGQNRVDQSLEFGLFDTIKDGAPSHESPEIGEVIWRDDLGVTCRRWNWRQGVRTRLSAEAKRMWFILESLPAMPEEALNEASDQLIKGLQLMMPDAVIESSLISIDAR